jgi:adenylate cyclase
MTQNPRFVGNLRFLVASLAAGGQFKEAHELGRALLRVNPP